jgi:ubiquinone/menaquinone biosynthesis C-methylase UbiE
MSGENERRRRQYAREAPRYDRQVALAERWLIGSEHRGWVCSRASGDTLEVAIGTGLNLPMYPNDVRLTGLDLTPEMLALARRRAERLGRAVALCEGDAQMLPFPNESFDTVVCTYSLCTVPDERTAILEMERVLRSGGSLILVDHIRSDVAPLYWLQRLIELLPTHNEDELTRRPLEHVVAAGLKLEERDRSRAGAVERLVARKP